MLSETPRPPAALLIFLCTLLFSGTASAAIIKGPYLQNMGPDSMTVMWETDASSAGSVEFGLSTSLGSVTAGASGTIHQIGLSGLAEDTTYYYRAVSGSDVSDTYTLRTASTTSTSFRFVAMGDSRSTPSVVATLSALVDVLDPAPVLGIHTGDLVALGTDYARWGNEFFTPEHPMIAKFPYYPSLGNHEANSQYFYDFFDLPNNERWYSVEYGNAVFIALDTNTAYTTYLPGSPQYVWFENALRQYADKTWKFVFFHNPPYSTGAHGSDLTVRQNLQGLFERYNVNVVFAGHDHDYERSLVNGITYIVTGGYGAPLYSQQTTSPYSVFFSSVHHVVVADVNGASLTLTAVDDTGATVESLSLGSPLLPVSMIDAPSDGVAIYSPKYTITGTAADPPPGAGITRVEVSTDGGLTWQDASGTDTWSFEWNIPMPGDYTIMTRATDIDSNVEVDGDSVAVSVPAFGEPELQHYFWDGSVIAEGCGACHVAPSSFLPADYLANSQGFCGSCHNSSGRGHDSVPGRSGHVMASVTGIGCIMPTYGNITGEYDNRPYAHLKEGDKVVCTTCHNAMRKTEDFGRVWELTATQDGLDYRLDNGGWYGYGYLEPRVYRSKSLDVPTTSREKARYLVDPSEYTYNEYSGIVTFSAAQDPLDYIRVSLGYPYLREGSKDNKLCSDCHTEVTHHNANCLVCHTAHSTSNLAGVRELVRAPDRVESPVVFTNTTGAGSFADGDGTYDGICEVCHTATLYYRRDGSGFANHSSGADYAGFDCTACHTHPAGFAR